MATKTTTGAKAVAGTKSARHAARIATAVPKAGPEVRQPATGSSTRAKAKPRQPARQELQLVCYIVLDPSRDSVEPVFLAVDLEPANAFRRAEAFLSGINSLRRDESECVLQEAQATVVFDGREPSETW